MRHPRISEIFGPTIQGEGAVIGEPTIFIRTGGCDYRCAWCDTMFAVDPKHAADWQFMDADAICTRVNELTQGRRMTITLSGGNPAMQPMRETCRRLRNMGHSIVLETQGTVIPDWLDQVNLVSISPKPPSARIKWDDAKFRAFMSACQGRRAVFKFVIADDEDFEFARRVTRMVAGIPVYLQPMNPDAGDGADAATLMERYRWLARKVIDAEWYTARVLPQLHALAWGGERAR